MTVVEIGDIGKVRNTILPKSMEMPKFGIIIEATPFELKNMPINLLLNKVHITREDDNR